MSSHRGETQPPELKRGNEHGIPVLDLSVNMEHYDDVHHKSSDTVDKVMAHNLTAGAGIVAVTAYALADRPERIAPQIKRDAIGELLKKANLEEFLKIVGV